MAEDSIPFRAIAEVIGRRLNLPAVGISPKAAAKQFGFLAPFAGADNPASSALTRAQLGWAPREVGLMADLELGRYFPAAPAVTAAPAPPGTQRIAQAA